MRQILILLLTLPLLACGGGGGGSSIASTDGSGGSSGDSGGSSGDSGGSSGDSTPPSIGPIDFVRFNQTDATIEAKGLRFDFSVNGNGYVSAITNAEDFTDGRVVADYNALGNLVSARVKNDDVDYIFDYESEIFSFTYVDAALASVDPVTATSNDEFLAVFDADGTYDRQYSEFGIWEDNNGSTTGNVGGVVVYGDFSTADQIPDSGTATYSGYHGGVYTDGSTGTILTTGDFDASVNFASRSVTAALSNTIGENSDFTYSNLSVLDFGGTFTANSDWHNGFLISSTTGNNDVLTGTTKFYFMGPNAEEIAGDFIMRNAGNNSTEIYAGGFWGGR